MQSLESWQNTGIFLTCYDDITVTIDTGASVTLRDADRDDYYEISTADELYAFAAAVNGGDNAINGELTANITVNEGTMTAETTGARAWTPIGNDTYAYLGTFDGGGHTISGLYFNDSTAYYVGLFGCLESGSTVKNVRITDSYICATYAVGGVAGRVFGGTVENCSNAGTVSGTGDHVGGVTGNSDGTVTGCYNTGTVSGTDFVGGVVGNSHGTMTGCYNTGTVSGTDFVGGVVGNSHGTMTGCYNTGTVTGTGTIVGGVVGDNMGTVGSCYNTGTVSGTGSYVGGVAGNNDSVYGTVTNCYYLDIAAYGGIKGGDVTGQAEAKTADQFKSGEVAYLLNGDQSTIVFKQTIGTDAYPSFTGGTVYQVKNCKEENDYSNTNENIGHQWVNGTCSVCDEVCGHTGGEATCTEQAVCTVCCESYGEVDADAHSYGDWVSNGDGTHTRTCANDSTHTENGDCSGGTATCKEQAVCDICKTAYGALAAHNIQNNVCTECGFTYYNLWVGGVQVNSDNAENVLGDSTVHYDADTQTITLSDADISTAALSENVPALKVPDGSITLVLTGENKLTGAENCPGILIESGASVTVAQDYAGSLDVQGQALGYLAQEKIYVNSSIAGDGDFTVAGGTVTGGIHMGGTITITGGTVNADFLAAENVVISGGTVTAAGQAKISYSDANAPVGTYGIYADKDIQISGGSVTVSGGYANITESYDPAKISTASATAAMYAGNAVTVTGGTVTATGGTWNGYYPSDLGLMQIGGGYTEDGEGDVKNVIDKYGKALKASSFTISKEASFTCGDGTAEHYSHSFAGATCSSSAVCAFCGTEDGKVDKTNHDETVAYENGFCPYCDAFEPAKLVNGVYEISNAGNLYWFADKVTNENAAYGSADAILTCDIRVNEGTMTEASTDARVWTPIGKIGLVGNQVVRYPYTGTFEGNGKTVSGLYFNDTSANFDVGLFSYVGEGGTVQNVGVADSYLCGSNSVGTVVGNNSGTVTGCYNTGTVIISGTAGGVVGYNTGTVSDCHNTGTVSGESSVGGVVGSNSGTLTDCHNTGIVSGESDVGGVVGRSIGGVYYNGIVTDYHNTDTVSGKDTVGGVAGYNSGSATNCTNSGTVSGTTDVGGVVGLGNASNCYNTGTVSGTTDVGGVAGYLMGEVSLMGCYSSGTVSGEDKVGGVVGRNITTVTNCYFDSTVYTGNAIGDGSGTATDVEGKTTEQFASGEVAYLLSQGEGGSIWGQDLDNGKTKQTTPTFTGAKVYCGYTSCGDTAAVYTNNANVFPEKPEHTQNPTYTDNHDGTHSAVYPCCGTTVTEEHNFENEAHQCICGKVENFTVYWPGETLELQNGISTYGQTFSQTVPVPENTHLRILEVNNKEDGTPVKYSFENDTLTIEAEDLPAADILVLCEHYVKVTCHANGGVIRPDDGFPLEGDNGFAEDASYWVQEWPVSEPIYPLQNGSAIRTGYTFVEWRDESGKVYPTNDAVRATVDVTIYAQWQANTYTVTWNVDGETSTTQQTYDAALILPESEPTKTGFDFVGWYTAAEGGEKVDGATVFQNANNDTIYYARFCNHSSSQHTAATPNEDGKTHSFTCTVCSKTSAENHTGGTATCIVQAVCEVCGTSYGELAAHTPDANGKCTVTDCGYQYVAKIGDTFYETIHKALRAAEENTGCTLILLDNITLTSSSTNASYVNKGTFTLDLNGKVLSSNKRTLEVMNSADLTIRDSIGSGKIVSTGGSAVYLSGGKLTIESGAFEGSLDGVFVSGNYSTVTAIIKGGTFSGSRAMITGYGSYCVIDLTNIDPAGFTLKNNGSGTFTPTLPEGYGMVGSDGKLLTSLSSEQSATVHKHEYKYTDIGDGKHQQACSCGLSVGTEETHTYTYAAGTDGKSIIESCTVCGSETGKLTINTPEQTCEYDGTRKISSLTTNNFEGVSNSEIVVTLTRDNQTMDGTVPVIAAGTYTTTATVKDVTVSATFTISPKELTPVLSGSVSKTYDGTPNVPNGHGLAIELNGVISGDVLSVTADYAYESGNAGETTVIASNITLSGDDAGNYKLTTNTASAEVGTIEKQKIDVSDMSWTVPQNAVYNDTEYTATLNGELPAGVVVTLSGDKATDAGSYTAEAVFSLAEGYSTDNYEIVNGEDLTADWTIAKKNIVGAQITLGTALTYNGEQQTQTVASVKIDGLTVTYTVSGNTGTDAKDYTLTITGTGNFEGIATAEWSIAKAEPQIVWGSGYGNTYGKNMYITAYINGVDGNMIPGTAVATVYDAEGNELNTVICTKTNSTGTYFYNWLNALSDGTYLTPGSYVVKLTYQGNENYNAKTVELVTYTINKAQAEITVDTTPITLTYGETVELPTATSDFGTVSCDKTAAELVNVGTYTVTYTVEGTDNYDGDTETVTVTIKPKSVTVKANAVSKIYGEADPKLTYTADGLVGNDTLSGSLSRAEGENAGTYAITVGTLANSNYTIEFTSANLTINPKAIAVTANPISKTYGEDDPALTYAVSGMVNGDRLSGVLTRTEGENVGTYAIEQGTLTAGDNYIITFTDAELTINKRTVTITAKDQTITYGGAISSTEITATGLVDGHAATVTLTPSTANVTVSGTITASAAVITADGTDVTANYEIGYATGKLVIQPDTSKIDALTTDNVTSANGEDIKAVQAMMASAETDGVDEATAAQWAAITATCEDLIDKIEAVETENARIADAVSEFDLATVKSSDETAISQLISDIDDQLATNNLTDEERSELEGLKTKCNNLIAKIDGTETLIGQLDKTVDDLDAETVKSTDKDTLEQVIEDAQALIDSGNVTEAEKEALVKTQEDAKALIKVIDDTAAENKELTDQAASFDEDTVKSTDKTELEQLADDIEALLDTDNLTEDERKALEEVQDQVQGMIDTIEDTAEDSKAATDAIDALDPATVTSDDKDELEQAIETIDELLKDDHLTEDEREALEDAKKEAEDLLEKIATVQDATETENTEKVEDVTSGNVQPEDKENLIDAKADLEKALEDNSGNYTEEEKKAIQDEIQRIEDAIEALENTEGVTDTITKLPETVEPDDEEAAEKILDAKEAYDDLTDHEKSLVDDTTKKKLDDLVAALTAYDIVKGDGSKWTKGSDGSLSFTANGPFSKFVGIEVDGEEVAERYYEAKSGSTIITLKQSYLKKLSTGEHTITVLYTDGETSGTFKILTQSSTPATGDDSNIFMWGSVMGISALGIVVLLVSQKRRKTAK